MTSIDPAEESRLHGIADGLATAAISASVDLDWHVGHVVNAKVYDAALLRENRGGRRIIDEDHRICDAIAAVRDHRALERWAEVFALLGDRAGWLCWSLSAEPAGFAFPTWRRSLRSRKRPCLRRCGCCAAVVRW